MMTYGDDMQLPEALVFRVAGFYSYKTCRVAEVENLADSFHPCSFRKSLSALAEQDHQQLPPTCGPPSSKSHRRLR